MASKKPSIIPVREQIYEYLKQAIITNEYKPGELLPIEHLANEFGVSATPIREALIRLESSGLLTLIPNKGAIITDFTQEDVINTWEMRKVLEPYAGKLSAKLDLDEEITSLEKKIDTILSYPFNLQNYIEVDRELHELLFIHVPNAILRDILSKILQNSMRMRYFAEGASINQTNVVSEVCSEHMNILASLRQHDPITVEQTVYTHILHSEKRTLESIQRHQRTP